MEFAYEMEMNKFLEREDLPKYIPDGEDMVIMTKYAHCPFLETKTDKIRESYVTMKAKEKGIDPTSFSRDGGEKGGRRNAPSGKFNAFKEMDKLKNGQHPDLALIPDGVAVVGKPLASSQPGARSGDKGSKRERDGDEEEKPAKLAKKDEVSPAAFCNRLHADVSSH